MALSSGANFRALRSLSRALLRGYFRDRTALAFSILLPVLFLVLFGALYRGSGAPKLPSSKSGTSAWSATPRANRACPAS